MPLTPYLAKLADRQDLSALEAQAAFDLIFEGHAPPDQLAQFLTGLQAKGETVNELRGAVVSMRGKMVAVSAPADAIDIVGTGGDAQGTLNVSTAVAIVAAACGVTVAKHGNRAASSRSGSSDVLAALGVRLDVRPATLQRCLTEARLCFLFAPLHHPAMRHVAEVRRSLKTRTIFNLLGPLTNPANVKRHLIGVYALDWLGPLAEVLKALGSERAWLTHGHDGLDEITTTAPTDVVELALDGLRHFTLTPAQAGLPTSALAALRGGDAVQNAAALRQLLAGQRGAYRDIVLFNAAAALVVAGLAPDLKQGVAQAEAAIDRGAATALLNHLITLTNEAGA